MERFLWLCLALTLTTVTGSGCTPPKPDDDRECVVTDAGERSCVLSTQKCVEDGPGQWVCRTQ